MPETNNIFNYTSTKNKSKKRTCGIHTQEYYSATKKNKITFSTTTKRESKKVGNGKKHQLEFKGGNNERRELDKCLTL